MLRSMLVAAALLVPAAALAQTAPGWTKSGPATQAAPAAPAAAGGNTGKVLEAQNAGGYTYLHIDSAGKDLWIAVPEGNFAPGATVQWAPGATMQNFYSKSLNKTFPQVVFSGGAQVVK